MTTAYWTPIKEYSDIRFELYRGVAKITINRPRGVQCFPPRDQQPNVRSHGHLP